MVRAIIITGLVCATLLGQGAWGTQRDNVISVTATDFRFDPNPWTMARGQPVTLTLTNRGANEHEWVLLKKGTTITPPFGAKDEDHVIWEIEVEPGATRTATFTAPPAAGTYPVIGGTPMHLEHGMTATLVVQ